MKTGTTAVAALILGGILALATAAGAQGQGQGQGNGNNNGVNGRVAALEAEVATLRSTITSLQSAIATLSAQLAALQNALNVEATARVQGDADTLIAAQTYADQATAQATADANAYTDVAIESANTRLVFATSTGYTGNLGGLTGADDACTAHATAAGLPGTYKAWLSDSTGSPSTRFDRPGATYKLVDGTVIAEGWEDLTDGSLDAPISIDESGNAATAGNQFAWTNTTTAGTPFGPNSCSNWTSTTANPASAPQVGNNAANSSAWTNGASSICSGGAATGRMLYCFQQ